MTATVRPLAPALLVPVLLAAALACGTLAAPAGAANPSLTLAYDNGSFTLTLGDGTPVRQGTVIAPGVYDILVVLVSGEPLLQLSGPGLSFQWSEFTSTTLTRVFAPDSTYTVQDGNPGSSPPVAFRTGAAVPTPTTTSTAPPSGPDESNTSVVGSALPAAAAGTLDATLAGSSAPILTRSGKPVARLHPGSYRLSVADRTGTAGLRLGKARGPYRALSGRTFVGDRTLTVVLTPGRWTLSAGPGRQRSFLVTVR